MIEYAIVLVCTDRGAHDAEVLHTVEITADDDTDASTLDAYRIAPTLPGSRLELPCGKCPRNPQIRGQQVVELFRVLLAKLSHEQRRVVFDVSQLPV